MPNWKDVLTHVEKALEIFNQAAPSNEHEAHRRGKQAEGHLHQALKQFGSNDPDATLLRDCYNLSHQATKAKNTGVGITALNQAKEKAKQIVEQSYLKLQPGVVKLAAPDQLSGRNFPYQQGSIFSETARAMYQLTQAIRQWPALNGVLGRLFQKYFLKLEQNGEFTMLAVDDRSVSNGVLGALRFTTRPEGRGQHYFSIRVSTQHSLNEVASIALHEFIHLFTQRLFLNRDALPYHVDDETRKAKLEQAYRQDSVRIQSVPTTSLTPTERELSNCLFHLIPNVYEKISGHIDYSEFPTFLLEHELLEPGCVRRVAPALAHYMEQEYFPVLLQHANPSRVITHPNFLEDGSRPSRQIPESQLPYDPAWTSMTDSIDESFMRQEIQGLRNFPRLNEMAQEQTFLPTLPMARAILKDRVLEARYSTTIDYWIAKFFGEEIARRSGYQFLKNWPSYLVDHPKVYLILYPFIRLLIMGVSVYDAIKENTLPLPRYFQQSLITYRDLSLYHDYLGLVSKVKDLIHCNERSLENCLGMFLPYMDEQQIQRANQRADAVAVRYSGSQMGNAMRLLGQSRLLMLGGNYRQGLTLWREAFSIEPDMATVMFIKFFSDAFLQKDKPHTEKLLQETADYMQRHKDSFSSGEYSELFLHFADFNVHKDFAVLNRNVRKYISANLRPDYMEGMYQGRFYEDCEFDEAILGRRNYSRHLAANQEAGVEIDTAELQRNNQAVERDIKTKHSYRISLNGILLDIAAIVMEDSLKTTEKPNSLRQKTFDKINRLIRSVQAIEPRLLPLLLQLRNAYQRNEMKQLGTIFLQGWQHKNSWEVAATLMEKMGGLLSIPRVWWPVKRGAETRYDVFTQHFGRVVNAVAVVNNLVQIPNLDRGRVFQEYAIMSPLVNMSSPILFRGLEYVYQQFNAGMLPESEYYYLAKEHLAALALAATYLVKSYRSSHLEHILQRNLMLASAMKELSKTLKTRLKKQQYVGLLYAIHHNADNFKRQRKYRDALEKVVELEKHLEFIKKDFGNDNEDYIKLISLSQEIRQKIQFLELIDAKQYVEAVKIATHIKNLDSQEKVSLIFALQQALAIVADPQERTQLLQLTHSICGDSHLGALSGALLLLEKHHIEVNSEILTGMTKNPAASITIARSIVALNSSYRLSTPAHLETVISSGRFAKEVALLFKGLFGNFGLFLRDKTRNSIAVIAQFDLRIYEAFAKSNLIWTGFITQIRKNMQDRNYHGQEILQGFEMLAAIFRWKNLENPTNIETLKTVLNSFVSLTKIFEMLDRNYYKYKTIAALPEERWRLNLLNDSNIESILGKLPYVDQLEEAIKILTGDLSISSDGLLSQNIFDLLVKNAQNAKSLATGIRWLRQGNIVFVRSEGVVINEDIQLLVRYSEFADPIGKCYYELNRAGFMTSLLDDSTKKAIADHYQHSPQLALELESLNKSARLTDQNFAAITRLFSQNPMKNSNSQSKLSEEKVPMGLFLQAPPSAPPATIKNEKNGVTFG